MTDEERDTDQIVAAFAGCTEAIDMFVEAIEQWARDLAQICDDIVKWMESIADTTQRGAFQRPRLRAPARLCFARQAPWLWHWSPMYGRR